MAGGTGLETSHTIPRHSRPCRTPDTSGFLAPLREMDLRDGVRDLPYDFSDARRRSPGACYRAGVAADPAQTLTVSARDLAERKFAPSAYPYQRLAVVQVAKIGTPAGGWGNIIGRAVRLTPAHRVRTQLIGSDLGVKTPQDLTQSPHSSATIEHGHCGDPDSAPYAPTSVSQTDASPSLDGSFDRGLSPWGLLAS